MKGLRRLWTYQGLWLLFSIERIQSHLWNTVWRLIILISASTCIFIFIFWLEKNNYQELRQDRTAVSVNLVRGQPSICANGIYYNVYESLTVDDMPTKRFLFSSKCLRTTARQLTTHTYTELWSSQLSFQIYITSRTLLRVPVISKDCFENQMGQYM